MGEALVFTLHGQRVETDDEGSYVCPVLKRVKTADMQVAMDAAQALAEETGFPVQMVSKAINIDRTIRPAYLKLAHHPDNG
jgi:hypothetical protein